MAPDYVDLTCVVHVHSTHSDGTGTVEQIARAAARARVDAVLLTDHDTLAGREGWYGEVLVLVGEEVTPPDRDHYLAFGVSERVSPRLSGPEICDAVRAQGGFGFAAHPWSRGNDRFKRGGYPWGDFDCLDGVELWSFLNDTGEKLRGVGDLVRMIAAPQSIIGGPPEANLRDWDRMCAARRVVAIGGLDAHQFGIRVGRWVPIRAMGYARTFRQLHTHVLVDEPLTGDLDADRERIHSALREGRCYIANDQVSKAAGFAFWADRSGADAPAPASSDEAASIPPVPTGDEAASIPPVPTGDEAASIPPVPMGAEAAFAPPLTIRARLPRAARIRLICDGALIAEADSDELVHPAESAGVYRVEAHLGGRPWIYSNPVYLRG